MHNNVKLKKKNKKLFANTMTKIKKKLSANTMTKIKKIKKNMHILLSYLKNL